MKKKKILFYFCMACIPVLMCLILAEVYFRVIRPHDVRYARIEGQIYALYGITSRFHYTFDPKTGYTMIPNIKDKDQLITTDQYGFRTTGRSVDLSRESIIFVGDSTVFGWGVKDSSVFSYLIAQKGGLEKLNIINMGVPSYSLGHITEVLKRKVSDFNPRIVIVAILWPWKPFSAYSTKDAWKDVDYEFYRKTIPVRTKYFFNPRGLMRQVIPRSFFVIRDYVLKNKYRDQIKRNLTRPGIRDFTISMEEERELAWAHVHALRGAVSRLREDGVEVMFYVHPYQYTVFHEDYQNLGKIGRELIISELGAIYMGDYLKEKFSGDPLFIDGSHMTDLGHRYYADYFYDMLNDKLTTHYN